jgi:hypothetical protein
LEKWRICVIWVIKILDVPFSPPPAEETDAFLFQSNAGSGNSSNPSLSILNSQFVPRQRSLQELQLLASAEYSELKAAGMTSREIGPAMSIAQDSTTGQFSSIYTNDRLGRMPANLSGSIASRLSTAPEYIKTRGIASHSEIYAADDLLKARSGATLGELRIATIETETASIRFQIKPPCPQCGHLLGGADLLK